MSSNAPHRVSDLFHRALEHPPSAREGFLKTECGADHSLFAEVRDLLAVYQDVETAPTPNLPDHRPGTRFGAYEIVRLIGTGGMGRVYLGRRADGAFSRDVAIKVIESESPTRELIARFEQERRILGSLRHPCIAQLLDAGQSESGQLYFVMEYVDGVRITEFCERRGLSLRARLTMFCRVCDAVEEAHRCLIVHRDLKPGNILVDSTGTPKLLDFGIAKPLTRAGLEASDPTLPILKRATPAYASPEQLQGDAAHTGMDVFSLGVVLHELVTGHRPSRMSQDATTGNASERFMPPSDVLARQGTSTASAHDVKGDLDAIILKTLDPDVGRRYGSAESLSKDVQAFVTGYPVSARRVTRAIRIGKFAQRNPVITLTSVVSILALIVAAISSSRVALSTARERDLAVAQLEGLKSLARSTFALDESLAAVAGATAPRRQLVEALNAYLTQVPVGDNRTLALETAEGYRRLGDIQGNPNGPNLGDPPAALRSYESARGLLMPLHELAPESEDVTVALSRIAAAMGDVFLAQKSYVSAGESYDNALSLANSQTDDGVGRVAHRVLRAGIHRPMGDLKRALGDFSAAQDHYQQALAIDLANTKQFPGEPEYRRLLALTYLRVAGMRAAQGMPTEARTGYQEATAILNALAGSGRGSAGLRRELAFGRARLGVMLEAEGNIGGRIEIRAAAEEFRSLMAEDPADARSRRDLMATLVQLGDAIRIDDAAAARAAYREAREVALVLAAGQDKDSPAGQDLAFVDRRLARVASGRDVTDLRLFRMVDGRRVLMQTGDPPPRLRTPIVADAVVSGGRSRYLLVFGADGPAEIFEERELSRAGWVVPAVGPPPAQTILLLATTQALSQSEKQRLREEVAAVEGPRTVDAESQIVWDLPGETLESTTTARELGSASWVSAIRARINSLGAIAIAGRTFPLAPATPD